MSFNPNAMMQKQVEKMISQRFGSVDNMMNDMSKFAGNNPTLKNALDLYKKGDTDQLHQIQQNVFNEKHLLPGLHHMVKKQYWVDAEEFVCNMLADYGCFVIGVAKDVLGNRFTYVAPVGAERMIA